MYNLKQIISKLEYYTVTYSAQRCLEVEYYQKTTICKIM